MMKKVLYLAVICALILAMLTACGDKKTAASADTFQSKAESAGMKVTDTTDSSDNTKVDYVDKALVATHTDGWQASFYVFSDESKAKAEFTSFKAQIENAITGSSSNSESSGSNYSTYDITGSGEYIYLSRVDNTMLMVETVDDHSDDAKDLIKDLDY